MFDKEHPYRELISQISAWQQCCQPLVIGLSGSQGSGKSTLGRFLVDELAKQYDLNAVCVSLDDYYLSKDERQVLANQGHPLFKTRGVPGTHHINQLISDIKAVKQGSSPILFPVFDKLIDQPSKAPHSVLQPIDILIVEGWCIGISALTVDQLMQQENELEKSFDANMLWRKHYNQVLKQAYQSAWQLFDRLIFLAAPDFNVVSQWRWQQEVHLARLTDENSSRTAMSKPEIEQFVLHFQRLTEHGLKTLPTVADVTFHLDNQRHISKVT